MSERIEKQRGPARGSSVIDRFRRACSLREMCSYDLIIKMDRLGLDLNEQSRILEILKEEKFLDEERYARAFVRDKSALDGWGSNKIKFALRNKRISNETISLAIGEIVSEDEERRLNKLLLIKAKSIKSEDSKIKNLNKLVRFAISRGFDYGLSLKVAKEIIG
ncbi:MAG: regulatory protein RecX [Bacteroidales bacterium]|jgi:regulatory protein|nr:regulatory protein RecX [Bacteroidales bacterium]MDD3273071.1 regulatory protein RecX [Bacteroidales bacterium]MDD4057558.1 regulatory protein RecX [Bacteroidales bacterium]